MAPASSRRTARTKDVNTLPTAGAGAVQPPKRVRRTKEQIEAAKEAEKIAKKKKETEKEKKLTNLAQAADNIVIEMQAQQSSEPRARSTTLKPPGPLKRTYATLNVFDSDKEDSVTTPDTEGQHSDYIPSKFDLESMDPRSDSAASDVEPPKKKRGKSKKASVLGEIQAKRKHLHPIPEETDKDVLMESETGDAAAESLALPFKAG